MHFQIIQINFTAASNLLIPTKIMNQNTKIFKIVSIFGEQLNGYACHLVQDQNPRVCNCPSHLQVHADLKIEMPSHQQGPFTQTVLCVQGNERPYVTSQCTHAKGQKYRCHGSFNLAFLDTCGFHMSTGIQHSSSRVLGLHI